MRALAAASAPREDIGLRIDALDWGALEAELNAYGAASRRS